MVPTQSHRLSELIDVPAWQTLLAAFHQATGIPIALSDLQQNWLVAVGWQDLCVQFHRACPASRQVCEASDAYAEQHLQNEGSITYCCPHGLIEVATPIVVEGERVGTFFIGQFLDHAPDREFFRRQAEHYGYDVPAYLQALDRLHVFSPAQVEAFKTFFTQLMALITRLGHDNLHRQQAEAALRQLNVELESAVAQRTQALQAQYQALQVERERLTHIIEGTHAATWEWNIHTGALMLNARWAEMVGYTLAELAPLNIGVWQRLAHPDDLQKSNALLARHFAGELPYYDCECRMRHKQGHWIWVRDRGKVMQWSDEGQPLWMYGTHLDVTAIKQAAQALVDEAAFRDTVFQTMADGVVVRDSSGAVIQHNQAAAKILGLSTDELCGRTSVDARWRVIHADGQTWLPEDDPAMQTLRTGLAMHDVTMGVQLPEGERRWMVVNVRPLGLLDSGLPRYAVATFLDDTLRREQAFQLQEAGAVFQASSQGIMTTDASAVIRSINPAFSRITGYAAAEVVGQKASMFKSQRHDQTFYAGLWRHLLEQGHWQGEIWNRRKNGEVYPQWVHISAVHDRAGPVTGYVCLFSDITERKQREERMWRQANFDALTGLANRHLMHDRLERALSQAERHGEKIGLLFIDLDGFKAINDQHGHAVGDEVLMGVALRLQYVVRAQDSAARLGGDEFTLIAQDLQHPSDLRAIAEKVLAALQAPFQLASGSHRVTASIGGAVYPDDATDIPSLLHGADVAMYRAKQSGKNQFFGSAG